jgi:hypothetical protein
MMRQLLYRFVLRALSRLLLWLARLCDYIGKTLCTQGGFSVRQVWVFWKLGSALFTASLRLLKIGMSVRA